MKSRRSVVLVVMGAVFCMLPSWAASAGPSEAKPGDVKAAAEAFDRGREAFKQENYEEAADNFEAADTRAPSAAALKLAIRARDLGRQLDRAATLAQLGLDRHVDDPELVELAEAVLERARPKLHAVRISCDEPCELLLDGKIVHGEAARERTVYVEPDAQYRVQATWSGERTSVREFSSEGGGQSELDFTAPVREEEEVATAPVEDTDDEGGSPFDDSSAPPEDRETSSGMSPAVFWMGVGLTGIAGGVTAWSGVDTQNNPGAANVKRECEGGSADCERLYQAGVDRQNRTNILLAVTGGLALTTILIGAAWTDWGDDPKSDTTARARRAPAAWSVRPWVSVGLDPTNSRAAGHEAQVGATGRF